MIVIAYLPLLVCVVGALVYGLASNPKAQELGRLAYACGLVAFCFALASHVVRIG